MDWPYYHAGEAFASKAKHGWRYSGRWKLKSPAVTDGKCFAPTPPSRQPSARVGVMYGDVVDEGDLGGMEEGEAEDGVDRVGG